MNYVWIYINTSKPVGDQDHVKVFADARFRRCLVQGPQSRGRGV